MENEQLDLSAALEAAGLDQLLAPQVASVSQTPEEALSLANRIIREGGRTGRQVGLLLRLALNVGECFCFISRLA